MGDGKTGDMGDRSVETICAMPWLKTDPMHQRRLFVNAVFERRLTVSKLCELFQISRKTGYKWLRRCVGEQGWSGLADRSRRPHSNSRAVPDEVVRRLVRMRDEHPSWGARKLAAWLAWREPHWELPAPSTITEILKRNGLVRDRRVRHRAPPRTAPLAHATFPNDVWCIDFKGDFLVGDGTRCYPLTVTDACTRALLCCRAFERTGRVGVQGALERTFRTYGLPKHLRSDNGRPFGTGCTSPLSKLGVWLVKLGVMPEYIDPGKPQQNGRHERMHRTLKEETAQPPSSTMIAQQRLFNAFLREYNHERPHEALGQITPAALYVESPRPFPARPLAPEYSHKHHVHLVGPNGRFRWRNRSMLVGSALAGERVGVLEVDDDCWDFYFGPFLVARVHDRVELGMRPRPE
jgi:putative transposase